MLGEAGVGYFFLRLHSDEVPQILLLTGPRDDCANIEHKAAELEMQKNAHLDVHFGRTIRVFDKLRPEIAPLRAASTGQPLQSIVSCVYDEACRRVLDESSRPISDMLADAFLLERIRYEWASRFTDFTRDLPAKLRRLALNEIDWEANAFVRSSSAVIIRCAYDWDDWLESG